MSPFSSTPSFTPPSSILIIGSGVFGLSTALSLSLRPSFSRTTITLLDRSPFPSPTASSIDTSRIIRADYSVPAYASLAARAQALWRDTSPDGLGGQGRYSESGLLLTANTAHAGEAYVRDSWANVQDLVPADDLVELRSHAAIVRTAGAGGGSGTWGYLNKASGWADAEASMRWLRDKVAALGRVRFLTGEATALLYSSSHDKVLGARLADGSTVRADLTIVAAGAWTPTLVDLSGRALATGQVLAYVQISDAEQERLSKMPVQLNFSTGMFVIPPSRNILKVARHGYGYTNPVAIAHPSPSRRGESLTVSMPATADTHPGLWIPAEAERACRQALREMVPELGEREFVKTRVCWYTDTPRGDFLITYHPEHEGLFMATGGSGHGFKFLPVIGDAIVDTLEGRCPEEFREKWAWPKERVASVVTEDGSRGGAPGLVLAEELGKGRGSRL